MLRFLRVTAVWILLLSPAATFLGAASNQLVLIANHDRFPVMINPVKLQIWTEGNTVQDGNITMIDPVHCVMTKDTHLNLLADVFDFRASIESIGDLLLQLGDWLATFCPFVWLAVVLMKLRATA